jgi:hypothetical protein
MRLARYLWAAPWTLVGLALTPFIVASGGSVAREAGVVELAGGILVPILRRLLPGGPVAAMTIGHVVVAVDRAALDRTRTHERVHVAQYERWGPFFPFVYAGASLSAWLRGGDYYLDNRFEHEARRASA